MCGQLLLGALHHAGHMIHRCLHARWCLRLSLIFLQGFLYPCNEITDHVGVMHSRVFNGEIGRISQLSVRHTNKLLKTNPRLMYCRNAIPIANRHPELDRSLEYDVSNIYCLELCILYPRDVDKLEEFLDCREHGRDRVARVVNFFFKMTSRSRSSCGINWP